MKSMLKYLIIVAISTVMLFGLVGCASNKISGNVKSVNTGGNIQSNQTEFNTEMSAFKKRVEDTSTSMSDNQMATLDAFEYKYLYPSNINNDSIQDKNQLIDYLEFKMTKGLNSNNTNYINNFIDVTHFASLGYVDTAFAEISNLHSELIDRISILLPAPKPIVVTPPPVVAPTIGMTALQVETSTWGDPTSKNVTITPGDDSEQWCYPNYQYIYLDNGIVTSIQTH